MLDSFLSISMALPAVSEVAANGPGHFAASVLALLTAFNLFGN
ncbi:hypothetical protein [Photobacterium sp. TY1-4]|nr:hypothetical protein [Photobacterium sp. TY1-4]